MQAFATCTAASAGPSRVSVSTHLSRACATNDNGKRPASAARLSRRAALVATAAAVVGVSIRGVGAREAGLEDLVNERYGYTFEAPTSGWTKNVTRLSGMRELTVFVKDGTDGNTNISMVETPVAGDFKKLTSFGPMETVLKTLVPDGQGGVTGEVIAASLDSKKNAYVVEYKLKPSKDAAMRHLLTVFSLQPGRFLLTLTAQTAETDWEGEAAFLRRVADSYRIKLMD